MATLVKYDDFVTQLRQGNHDGWLDGAAGDGDALKVTLTASAPTPGSDTVFADIGEISYANADWSAGGEDIENTSSQTAGIITVVAVDKTVTATGTMPTFAYAVIYNSTDDGLIGYYSIGSSITLSSGESFTIDFGASLCTVE